MLKAWRFEEPDRVPLEMLTPPWLGKDHFAVEPLEPPPYGDNILAKAKKQVGTRMLLSGNIVSQAFPIESFKVGDVRDLVKKAIEDGASGGGFTLRTTGGAVGYGKTKEQCLKSIECGHALIDAWREFGSY